MRSSTWTSLARAYPLLAHADMVAGWRQNRQDSWVRKSLAAVFNVLQRCLLGTRARDVDCAFKLFRRSFFERVDLTSSGFLIDAELYARARMAGLRVAQLPVRHRPRQAGRSSIRPTTLWRSATQLWSLARVLRAERRSPSATALRPSELREPGRVGLASTKLVRRTLVAALPAVVLGLAWQGSRGLWEPDEGRNANIALGMLESGDGLVPRLNDDPYLDKPPLHFWSVAAGMRLLGVNEWGARVPNALFFIATALWSGRSAGECGTSEPADGARWVYATTLAPFAAANVLTPDTGLAAFVILLVYAYWRAEHGGARTDRALRLVAAGGGGRRTRAAHQGTGRAGLPAAARGTRCHLRWRHRDGSLGPGSVAGSGGGGAARPRLVSPHRSFASRRRRLPARQSSGRTTGGRRSGTAAPDGRARSRCTCRPWWPASSPGPAGGWRTFGDCAGYVPSASSASGLLFGLWFALPLAVFVLASSRLPLYLLPLFAPFALVTGRSLALAWSEASAA